MKDSGTAIMNAAAQVREMLIGMAASRFGVPADSLVVAERQRFAPPTAARVSYGELVAGQSLHVAGAAAIEAARSEESHRASARRCRASTFRPR